LYVIAQPSGASRKGDSDDTRAESRRWAARLRGRWRRARSSQTVQLARLIEEVIGTARQLAEQNAIGSTVNSVQCGNGPYDRASGSIRSTQTRRHFANLTGKSSATARDGNPSRSVTTLPS